MTANNPQILLIQSAPMRSSLLGGISEMTLHRLLKKPEAKFPRPIRIGARRFWRVADVMQWIENQGERA